MKIPSFQKIESQARAYTKAAYVPDPVLLAEMFDLEKKQNKLNLAWAKIRDEFCTGHPRCICATHAKYQPYQDAVQPLASRLSEIYHLQQQARQRIFNQKKAQLLIARQAKLNYLSFGQAGFMQ